MTHLPPDDPPITLARSDADGFDIALRQRTPGTRPQTITHRPDADEQELLGPEVVHELIVNGMFAMDSTDRSSELALADLAAPDADRVLVGGLGLGFTAQRVLRRCAHATVDVVDLSRALIEWAREGLTPTLRDVAASPRVRLHACDVAAALSAPAFSDEPHHPTGPWDAILLDVDNGPDFLIHDHNARLYESDLLTGAFGLLTTGGILAVWSERESTILGERMAALVNTGDAAATGTLIVPVHRDAHHIDYAIHWVRRTPAG